MNTLSIVFQGPLLRCGKLDDQLLNNISRTKSYYPDAEIIVSTLRDSSLDENEVNDAISRIGAKLILSLDPGRVTVSCDKGVFHSNVNRMLVTSRAGLSAATRPLVVKMRTDSFLYNSKLKTLLRGLNNLELTYPRDDQFKVFSSRIINCSLIARDARGSLPYLYHPSDIFLAGNTEDVRVFFNAPLASPEDLFAPVEMPGLLSVWRYVPEQWCWLHAIRSMTGRCVYPGNFNYTSENIERSERYMITNFVNYSPCQLGFSWPKYRTKYFFRGLFSTINHGRWLALAKLYRDGLAKNESPYSVLTYVSIWIWRVGYRLRIAIFKVMPKSLQFFLTKLFHQRR